MNKLISVILTLSFAAMAQAQERKFLVCAGTALNGIKVPVHVQLYVLNSKQVEGMKIQIKSQVLVNEVNRVEGKAYNDGIISNHLAFTAKTDKYLSVILPVNFRMMKTTEAFLAQEKGDDVTLTAISCSFK